VCVISNWLDFISSFSTPIVDANDLNKVETEITFECEKIAPTNKSVNIGGSTIHRFLEMNKER
jgi:hypothetical protein